MSAPPVPAWRRGLPAGRLIRHSPMAGSTPTAPTTFRSIGENAGPAPPNVAQWSKPQVLSPMLTKPAVLKPIARAFAIMESLARPAFTDVTVVEMPTAGSNAANRVVRGFHAPLGTP